MSRPLQVTTRNAAYQQWQALLTNRRRRHRAGEFLVQGVRPLTLAVDHGWEVRHVLYDLSAARTSTWATDLLDRATAAGAVRVETTAELLAELGERDEDQAPELVAVVAMRDDDVRRALPDDLRLAVVLDRPTSPGNLGSVIRSADALAAQGVVVSGHAADPYDPQCVRATTGSLFALPVVRVEGPPAVLDRLAELRTAGRGVTLVATDERNAVDVWDHDLATPTVVLAGNETHGLATAWRDAADASVRIPMSGAGAASSLNLAAATTAVLYEAARQRAAR